MSKSCPSCYPVILSKTKCAACAQLTESKANRRNAGRLFLLCMTCLLSGCASTRTAVTVRPLNTPLKLYPPHEMSILEIGIAEFPSQTFRLWLPEMVTAKGGRSLYNQAHVGPHHWTIDRGGARFECQSFETPTLAVTARLETAKERATLTYIVENRSDETLHEVALGTCYQLAHAPNFRDQKGHRTYVWVGDRLANIAREGKPAEGHDHHDPQKSSFMSMPGSPDGIGIMAVEAQGGGCTAIAWQTHREYAGNTDPFLNCLHADPVVRELAPGQQVVIHGIIGWSKGSVEALCNGLRQELSAVRQ